MANDVVNFSGHLPANPAELLKGLQNMGGAIAAGTGSGKPLLRLIKSGEFVYGPENIEVEQGSEWAMNPASLQHGYACWIDSELLGEQLVPFNLPPPSRDQLPDYGDPSAWKQEVSMELRCMTGEDEGVVVQYKSTALGFRTAVKNLILEMMQQVQADPKHIVPVFELGVDSYQHKKHGKTFFPVIEVSRWINADGEGTAAPAVAAMEAAIAASVAAVAAEPVAPPAPPAAAPAEPAVRRRRRAV